MLVHVTLHPSLPIVRRDKGQRQVEVALDANATVADLLARFALPRNVVVLLNGRPVIDLTTWLAEGDNIVLLASISGG